jgi:hypothetical protein
MITCPSCSEPGIWQVRYAISGANVPAKCDLCGAFASPSTWAVLASSAVIQLFFYIALVLAFHYWNIWPFLAALGLWALIDLAIVRFTKPVARSAPTRTQVVGHWGVIGLLLLLGSALSVKLFT